MIRDRQFEVIKTQQVNQHLFCSICREVFYNPIRATCGHTFCGTCLVRWIQMKKSCPLCRHRLERNYQFDKDILATKIVGDIEVKCLRCQLWEGTLASFKQHKKSQCTYISTNNQTHQDAIEIGDDDEEFTFAALVTENEPTVQQQIIGNIGQLILASINQTQNLIQQDQPQQILNLSIQDIPQETNFNNEIIPHPQNVQNNNNELPQENPEIINPLIQNNQEKQINISFPQDPIDSSNCNNAFNPDDQNISQVNQFQNYQQTVIESVTNPNLEESEQQQQQDLKNQSLVFKENLENLDNQNNNNNKLDNNNNNNQENYDNNLNNNNNNNVNEIQNNMINHNEKQIQQENIQLIEYNQSNKIQPLIHDDQQKDLQQYQLQHQSVIEQFRNNDPDIIIVDPPIKFINNKDLKKLKANTKFKINILKNNVKIAEPTMEELNENIFFEFLNHMKSEMVKKLSDIQYYNTLIG